LLTVLPKPRHRYHWCQTDRVKRLDHVLVVDDDDGIREMLQTTLAFAGFQVSAAADAQAALGLLSKANPDAVVLDVMMPGIDGFEFVQLLRHRGDTLPVLFLSARDTVEDRVRGLRLGADDYLTKPFSVVEVTVRLESLLRRARAPHASDDSVASVLRCADLELDERRHRRRSSGCLRTCCCTRVASCRRRRSSSSCGSTTSTATATSSSASCPICGERSTGMAPH
jgi:CheY-like chemotaxis protein